MTSPPAAAYHALVHRFILIMLLILVPVRAFGAESMGLCMMQSASHAQEEASMPDDCPMMMAKGDASGPSKHDGGCESCQLCMPFAGPDATPQLSPARPGVEIPAAPRLSFHSADIARALKPPIA
jgi:hypothetical protein